jgi:hypothetical protein
MALQLALDVQIPKSFGGCEGISIYIGKPVAGCFVCSTESLGLQGCEGICHLHR